MNKFVEKARVNFFDSSMTLPKFLRELEKSIIEQSLEVTHGNCSVASQALGLQRTCLVEKRRKYGLAINPPS